MELRKTLVASSVAACLLQMTHTPVYAQEDGVSTADREQNVTEVIEIKGIRGSAVRSVFDKRQADSIIESISAEDIGRLPDITIADSLQRVTGIQINRSAGEGAQVNIRGLSQVTTLLNGEQFISAGSITGLQPDFNDILAELLGGVEVYKSAESSLMNGGISGTINLKSRRPLSLDEGWTFVGSAEGSDGNYTDETGKKFTAFAGYNGDDFGAIITATKSDATLANYRYGMFSDWVYRGYHQDVDGDGNQDVLFGNIDYGITNKTAVRDRQGTSASFQYYVNDNIELVGDIFYTEMENDDLANGLVVDNAWQRYGGYVNPIDYENRGQGVVAEGHEGEDFYTTSYFDLIAPRVLSKGEAIHSERDSLNLNLQANLNLSERLTASVRYVHGKATSKTTNNYADAYVTSGAQQNLYRRVNGEEVVVNPGGYGPEDAVVNVDMRGDFPTFTFPSGFGTSIDQYALVSTFSENNRDDEAELDAFRVDGRYDFIDSVGPFETFSLEFGARIANRKVTSTNYDLVAPFTRALNDNSGDVLTSYAKWKDAGIAIDAGSGDTIGHYIGYSELQEMGYISEVSDFGPASNGSSFFFINPSVMSNARAFQDSIYPGNIRATNWFNSYIVEEDTQTYYLQANVSGEAFVPYEANVGVQIVDSSMDVTGYDAGNTSYLDVDGVRYNAIAGAPGPLVGTNVTSKDRTEVLPRINVSFDLMDDLKLRLSYTENLTQLDANLLGAGSRITFTPYGDEELKGVFQAQQVDQTGNPQLNPWRSTNYDLSLEWYFNDQGILSLGLYRLEIDSFPNTVRTTVEGIADSDGVVRNDGIPYSYPENGDSGELQGYEIGYQQAYDFLPGLLSGLGSTINYTWTDGEGGAQDFYGKSMIMPDNSEHQMNAILWYQKGAFQARIAYNYRSERYNGTPGLDGHFAAYMTSPTEYVDASINYEINENVEVYLQGQNITEEYESTYMQWEDVKVNQNVFEARYTLGIRASF